MFVIAGVFSFVVSIGSLGSPTRSMSRTRSATRSPYPFLYMVQPSASAFDLGSSLDGTTSSYFPLTYSGLQKVVKVNGSSSGLATGWSVTLNGVTARTTFTFIPPIVVVEFGVSNGNFAIVEAGISFTTRC
jgi:hypothetical protein